MRCQPLELLDSAQTVQHTAVAGSAFTQGESGEPVVVLSLGKTVRQGGTIDGACNAQNRRNAMGQLRIGNQKMQNIGGAL